MKIQADEIGARCSSQQFMVEQSKSYKNCFGLNKYFNFVLNLV